MGQRACLRASPHLDQPVELSRSCQQRAVSRGGEQLGRLRDAARPADDPAPIYPAEQPEPVPRRRPQRGPCPPQRVHRLLMSHLAARSPPLCARAWLSVIEADVPAGPNSEARSTVSGPVGTADVVAVRPEQLDDLAELAAGDSNVPAGAEGKQRPALVLEHAELVRRLVERREGE